MKLLITKKFSSKDFQYIQEKLDGILEIVTPKNYTQPNEIQSADIILGEPPEKKYLDIAKRLQLIQIPWTGVDRLDFSLLKNYSFVVANSHSNASSVAELAVGLMISLVKAIPLHDRYLRKGEWLRPNHKLFSPPPLISGKKVLIVGTGHIGRQISKMMSGFSVIIEGVSRTGNPVPTDFSMVYPVKRLQEILPRYDYIFVAVPLTKQTESLFTANILKACKKSAYITTVSRGPIFNERDFFHALKNKTVAGAAIDTWYTYPSPVSPQSLPSQYPFHELDNVILSPHRGGFVANDLPHLHDALANIKRFVGGKKIENAINLNSEY